MPLSYPDWSEWSWYVYLAVGGAVLILASAGMYFSSASQNKVPAYLLAIVGGLGLGAAGAIIGMMGFGWRWYAQKYDNGTQMAAPTMPVNAGGPPMGEGGPRGGGMRGGGGPRGGSGPNSKNQLASLITRLDLLTHERPAVKLDGEQKKKMREQILQLDEKEELSEEEAKKKLDAVMEILTDDQRKTLGEAGATGAGQRGGNRGGEAPANPFLEGQANQHLKSLRGELEGKKTE
jgi:hypothetical protein